MLRKLLPAGIRSVWPTPEWPQAALVREKYPRPAGRLPLDDAVFSAISSTDPEMLNATSLPNMSQPFYLCCLLLTEPKLSQTYS